MRIDFAHTIAGLRVNEWISVLAFIGASAFIVTGRSESATQLEVSQDAGEPTSRRR